MTRTAILIIFVLILLGVLLGNVSHQEQATNQESKSQPLEYSKDFVKPTAWQNHEKLMEMERKQGKSEHNYLYLGTNSSGK